MADIPSARLQDTAGSARPAHETSRPAGLSPEETEAANIALQGVLANMPGGSGVPFGRLKPMRGAHVPAEPRRLPRITWDRLRRGQAVLGSFILLAAIAAAASGIFLAASESDSPATTPASVSNQPPASAQSTPPAAVAPGLAASPEPEPASPSPAASPSAAAAAATATTVPSTPTSVASATPATASPSPTATAASPTAIPGLTAIAGVAVTEPLVPAMPALAAGFHNAWLTAPGEDCSAVVGTYRPQELVENANPGLSTGARCSDLEPGPRLRPAGIDRGMTGTPACLGAVRVPAGLVLVWGILGASESSSAAAGVAVGVRTGTGAAVYGTLARISLAAPHGACLLTFPPTVNTEAGVFQVQGVAALIFDLQPIAEGLDVSNLPVCD